MTAAAKPTYLHTQTLFLSHHPSTRRPRGTKEEINFLTNQWPNHTVTDALNRMRQVIGTFDWGPDVLVKICHNMDTAFFNGVLRFRVLASWEGRVSMYSSRFPDPDSVNRLGSTQFGPVDNVCHILCPTSSSTSGAAARPAATSSPADFRV